MAKQFSRDPKGLIPEKDCVVCKSKMDLVKVVPGNRMMWRCDSCGTYVTKVKRDCK